AARPLATTEVRIYMQGGSQPEQPDPATASSTVRAVALTLPSVTQLPRSVAWTLLRRNQLARDQGRPMYLVEDSGETVLASDEEGEAHKSPPWHSSDGSAVDAALKGVATQLGCSEEVRVPGPLHLGFPTLHPCTPPCRHEDHAMGGDRDRDRDRDPNLTPLTFCLYQPLQPA
ncbi:hypothetical protein QJQ45_016334, partial [Haematococcus lacustris]